MRRGMRLRAMVSFAGQREEEGPPLDLLKVWHRADDIESADGAPVPKWVDRSGYGNDAATIAGVNNPTFVASSPTLGGKPALAFAGAEALWAVNPTGIGLAGAPVTTYVVMDPDYSGATPNYQVAYSFGKNAGTPGPPGSVFLSLVMSGPNRVCVDVLIGGWRSTTGAGGGPIIQSFGIAENANVATADYRINNEAANFVDFAPFGALNIQSPVEYSAIGCQSGYNGDYFYGQIAEIMYYGKQHTADERAATLAYLSKRYSIALM